jgi:hypothetical protein
LSQPAPAVDRPKLILFSDPVEIARQLLREEELRRSHRDAASPPS